MAIAHPRANAAETQPLTRAEIHAMGRFLRDRIAEQHTAATAATRGPWYAASAPGHGCAIATSNSSAIDAGKVWVAAGCMVCGQPVTEQDARHAALHDPYKVLSRLRSDIIVLEDCLYWVSRTVANDPNRATFRGRYDSAVKVLQAMAYGYDWHPGWQDRWRPVGAS